MTDRKKSGVAFWATVVVVASLAYPLSAGPFALACRLAGRPHLLYTASCYIYGPLVCTVDHGPDWLQGMFNAYMECWDGP
jgi:hypothetical protein